MDRVCRGCIDTLDVHSAGGQGGEAVDGGLARYAGLLPLLDEPLSHGPFVLAECISGDGVIEAPDDADRRWWL